METSIRVKGKGMPESPSQPPPDSPATRQFAAALECVQAPLHRFVRGMVGKMVGSDEQAQDIVQDVFVDAWRATMQGRAPFDGVHDDQELRRWLFHVAYQRAVSALRHSNVLRVESLDVFPPPEPVQFYQPARFEDRIAEGEALQATFNLLGPQDTACLLLVIVHGFSASEMAAILEISPAAAKKRLTRAKQRLREGYFASQRQSETGAKGGLRP